MNVNNVKIRENDDTEDTGREAHGGPSMVRVLGRSAFHDTALTSSGDLCYLGGEVCFLFFVFLFSCGILLIYLM